MEWRQFVMNLEALSPDSVEELFERHGAEAVTFSDAGDEPVLEPAPGETPLWSKVRITGLFPADADLEALRDDLLRSFQLADLPEHCIETLEDRVWEREWLKDFRPMRFGRRLWVCPDRLQVDAADAVIVRLDPGLAFGTGRHPTTALCLEWLESQDLKDKRVLDFGCGSGVLSIAALKLGASSVTAVDIDPQAMTATRQNAGRNEVDDRLETTLDASNLHAAYDVAVANILAEPLMRQAGTICGHLVPGGTLALSGITDQQTAMVADAYRGLIDFDPAVVRASWARLTGRRT